MSDEKRSDNVYGENHPASDDKKTPGIRDAEKDRSTEQTLEETRQEDAASGENSGGMGRKETPRDGETQGEWAHGERTDGG